MAENTILIIDDEELIRKVLDVKLKSLDYSTLLAKDSVEAFKHLEKESTDTRYPCTSLSFYKIEI